MKKVKSGSDISFSFNVKVTDKTTVDEIIREASDIIKVRFAEYKVEPEESEDEKIRRTLVEYFGPEAQLDFIRGVKIQKIRDWLEKQKDHFRDDTKKVEKQDYSDLTDLERAIHRGFLVAGVENVPVTIIKETAKECLAQMKPAEWSEEDELMRTAIIQTLERFGGRGTTGMQIDWLKFLRPQPHWKPSGEQMSILKAVKEYVGCGSGYWGEGLGSLIKDLEKLI